ADRRADRLRDLAHVEDANGHGRVSFRRRAVWRNSPRDATSAQPPPKGTRTVTSNSKLRVRGHFSGFRLLISGGSRAGRMPPCSRRPYGRGGDGLKQVVPVLEDHVGRDGPQMLEEAVF